MREDGRWDALFADLEAQAEAASAAELAAEVADRTRRERRLVTLSGRLAALAGRAAEVDVHLLGGERVTGRVSDVGEDWFALAEAPAGVALVRVAGVAEVRGLSAEHRELDAVAARRDLGSALRGLARDRAAVTVLRVDGTRVSGTVDAVGADAVDLAVHAHGEPRRPRAVRGVRTLPLAAVAAVRAGRAS